MAKTKETPKFEIGQMVRFYVIRFKKWYEGKVEGQDQEGDLKGCYNVRVTKAEGRYAYLEIGNLWAVDPLLMEAM